MFLDKITISIVSSDQYCFKHNQLHTWRNKQGTQSMSGMEGDNVTLEVSQMTRQYLHTNYKGWHMKVLRKSSQTSGLDKQYFLPKIHFEHKIHNVFFVF